DFHVTGVQTCALPIFARRDWIHWITSGKQAATRARRIATACDQLAAGKRRACCFDRSGMYSRSMSAPVAADQPHRDPPIQERLRSEERRVGDECRARG